MPVKTLTLKTGRRVMTGCNPTPPNRLLFARPFIRRFAAPEECFNSNGTPMQMDGNDIYGDCPDACLGNILDVIKRILAYSGGPIPGANVIDWARRLGFLNGANIPDVLNALMDTPMIDESGQANLIGPHVGVPFDDLPTVKEALSSHYALDLGVNAGPLQDCIGNDPVAVMPILTSPVNGYDQIDHSIPAFDYATAGNLAANYADKYKFAVQLGDLPAETPCIGLESWGTVVIAPEISFRYIAGEAWAITSFPAPGVAPPPPPTPRPPTQRGMAILNHLAEVYDRNPGKVLRLLDWLESEYVIPAKSEKEDDRPQYMR